MLYNESYRPRHTRTQRHTHTDGRGPKIILCFGPCWHAG